MATKEVTLKNRWMDSLEKACLKVTSPSGKTIVISKIALFDVKLSEKVNGTLRRFVRGTKLWDEVDFVSNVEEMKDLLSIASRMY
nr:MAG TPA: hypothetical protein [Caudoviricetes sp.]